jgi:hypothetical protein
MPARLALEETCSRCPRVESREVTLEEAAKLAKSGLKPKATALKVMVEGKAHFEFETLCETCKKIVLGYLASASKQLKHRSSLRETDGVAIEVDEEAAE